jgi:hypothetical protein
MDLTLGWLSLFVNSECLGAIRNVMPQPDYPPFRCFMDIDECYENNLYTHIRKGFTYTYCPIHGPINHLSRAYPSDPHYFRLCPAEYCGECCLIIHETYVAFYTERSDGTMKLNEIRIRFE